MQCFDPPSVRAGRIVFFAFFCLSASLGSEGLEIIWFDGCLLASQLLGLAGM